jgi:proteasome beta subunit
MQQAAQRFSSEDLKKIRETGTTTIGMMCKDALVIASESKSTMGYLVSSKDAQKVFQVDDKIAITTAGGAGDTLAIIRVLKAEIALYKNMRNAQEFSVKATINLLANVLQSSRYYPLMAMLVVGGYDKSGFRLYSIDPLGGFEEEKNFTATGSGSPMAYGVLEADWKEGMSKEEGIRLAARAINSARERDIFSGGKLQAVVITRDGIESVPSEKLAEFVKPEAKK